MYLRETKRKNKDGSVVRYLSRDPETGRSTPEIIHCDNGWEAFRGSV